MKNKKCYLYWGWFWLLIFIIFLGFSYYYSVRTKEGFTWSKQSIDDFLQLQETVNPNTQFDINMIQKQASESELQELLETGRWPWACSPTEPCWSPQRECVAGIRSQCQQAEHPAEEAPIV